MNIQSRGMDINITNLDEVRPLQSAIDHRLDTMLPTLIESSNDLNIVNACDHGNLHTILAKFYNCKFGSIDSDENTMIVDTIEKMLNEGADVNVVDKNGNTPLHIAARQKNDRLIRIMLRYFTNVNAQNNWGETILHIFIGNCIDDYGRLEKNYEHYVRTILSRGADVNLKNGKGMTPVHLAVLRHDKIFKILVDVGADLQAKTDNGSDLFQLLISRNAIGINEPDAYKNFIDILLSNGFDIDGVDNHGYTLLQQATIWAELQLIEVLLEKGAKVNCTDKNLRQFTPLRIAIELRSASVVATLLKYGADVNIWTENGESLLMKAVKKGNIEVIKLLLDNGADVNVYSKISKLTALHVAANENHEDAVNVLAKAGAEVNARNALGETPLHLAAQYQSNIVENLVKLGAKIYLTDNENRSALHKTVEYNNVVGLYYFLTNGPYNDELRNVQFRMTSLLSNEDIALRIYILSHFIKLNAANLLVLRLDEDYIRKGKYYHEQCVQEVRKMKEQSWGPGSMYDFIHVKPESRLMYKKVFFNFNLHKKYPIYFTIIKAKRDEALERNNLLKLAMLNWYEIINVNLPVLCLTRIFDYLNNDTLKIFVQCVEETR